MLAALGWLPRRPRHTVSPAPAGFTHGRSLVQPLSPGTANVPRNWRTHRQLLHSRRNNPSKRATATTTSIVSIGRASRERLRSVHAKQQRDALFSVRQTACHLPSRAPAKVSTRAESDCGAAFHIVNVRFGRLPILAAPAAVAGTASPPGAHDSVGGGGIASIRGANKQPVCHGTCTCPREEACYPALRIALPTWLNSILISA
jgi:hypothetical protein